MSWKCPICRKVITVVTPYLNDNEKVIMCCDNCAEKNNWEVAQRRVWMVNGIPNWKVDIDVIKENE